MKTSDLARSVPTLLRFLNQLPVFHRWIIYVTLGFLIANFLGAVFLTGLVITLKYRTLVVLGLVALWFFRRRSKRRLVLPAPKLPITERSQS